MNGLLIDEANAFPKLNPTERQTINPGPAVEAKGLFGRIWARIVFWIMSLFSIGK